LGFIILGFHTLGLYIHNDTVVVWTTGKQILFEPLFAEYIQAASGKAVYEFNVLLSDSTSPATVAGNQIWLPGWLEAINSGKNDLFLKLVLGLLSSSCDCFRFTYYNILVKGALDARGSKLMPEKRFWL
jgi:photosystem I P700 chlorophyll a apoprotein A2